MSTTISSSSVQTSSTFQSSSSSTASVTAREKPASGSEATPQPAVPQDQVALGKTRSEEAQVYGRPRPKSAEEVGAMIDAANQKAEELLQLIRPLIEQQGLNMAKVVSGEQRLSGVDQATIDKAKADIAEDGEWGVRKVSERILSFAKFAMGDDPAKLDKIRAAVQQGFDEAKAMLGGALPEISQQTYDTIMAEFDRWEKEGIPGGESVTLPRQASQTAEAASGKAREPGA
ncbi:hypothetical protein [Chitinilyticum litopenaei]|uniref:hypothetical protein n=1 Tax=Chitinilyticum litopenaei TaxID=1121276 RepID=UPI000415C998|nr:hypothetical protein [Chitinilyticum litopenaei]